MSKRVIIEPEAEADIAAAYHWYENQRPGLGDDFALCIEAAPSVPDPSQKSTKRREGSSSTASPT